jgi:hypothetical protein
MVLLLNWPVFGFAKTVLNSFDPWIAFGYSGNADDIGTRLDRLGRDTRDVLNVICESAR